MYFSIQVAGTAVAASTGTAVASVVPVPVAAAVVAVGAGDVAVGALVAVGSAPPAQARAATIMTAAKTAIIGRSLNALSKLIPWTPFLVLILIKATIYIVASSHANIGDLGCQNRLATAFVVLEYAYESYRYTPSLSQVFPQDIGDQLRFP